MDPNELDTLTKMDWKKKKEIRTKNNSDCNRASSTDLLTAELHHATLWSFASLLKEIANPKNKTAWQFKLSLRVRQPQPGQLRDPPESQPMSFPKA